jgi:hypothetical protein
MKASSIAPGPHERRTFPWNSIEDWLTRDFGASDARSIDVSGQDS